MSDILLNDFLADHSVIEKEGIFNIHEYLIEKNNKKIMFRLIKQTFLV